MAAQDNYIVCSFTVKSELWFLFCKWKNIGQIDIVLDPFEADENFRV
jgi:hypothetical protein